MSIDLLPSFVPDLLAPLRQQPQHTLIALDYDGTLAPIVPTPSQAVPHPKVPNLLRELTQSYQVVLLTGRPIADLEKLTDFLSIPGLDIYGHYGADRYINGSWQPAPIPQDLHLVKQQVRVQLAHQPGIHLEDKGASFAAHWRQASDPAAAAQSVETVLQEAVAETDLVLVRGKMVWEVTTPGVDKGTTLRALLAERAVTGLFYAGDDIGDLPAVHVAANWAQEAPHHYRVVCFSASSGGPTEFGELADIQVPGPDGVAQVLAALR